MKCPYCNLDLEELGYDYRNGILKKTFSCNKCDKLFERHRIKDSLGLIKSDSLYEINEAGEYKNSW